MRCFVVFGVTLRLLVINVLSSSPAVNRAAYYQRCVTTCGGTVAVVHRRPCWQHLACCSFNVNVNVNLYSASSPTAGSEARYRLRIAISAYPTCIRRPRYGGEGFRRSIAMSFGTEKLERFGYPMLKNFLMTCLFVLTECTNVTDRHTDTAWWHRPRLHSIARQK